MAAAASAFNREGAFSFNPCASPPLNIGERVVWLGNDEPEHGTVRWMGILLDISKDWTAGVELDNPVGGMDGNWGGNKLFDCKPNHGMVIALHGLIKEEDFGGGFELVSPPSLEVALTNDVAGSSLTNGYKTDDASTDQKQDVPASENEGDKYIEKFLAAQCTPRTGASSFDRRVYAHMFAECEVEKWYEVLDFPQDAACGSLDVGFEKSRKKKKDSLMRESKDATLCRNGEYVESKKKERGGIFRFFRWLRRSRSSKALDSSTRRTRSALRVSDFQRVKTKSLESVTSLSESFHYIPVGVRCSNDGVESKDYFYEDLELAPKPGAAKLKCSSMSRVNCEELERQKLGAFYEDHRPRSVRSACSPSLPNSSLSRKKRRAPLPPALGTPAGRRSAVGPRNHWTRVLPEAAGSTSRLSNGDIALSHLGDLDRKIASSTGAIYKDPSRIKAKADPDPKPPEFASAALHKRSSSLTGTDVPKVPASPQRVGSHIKNKRKAPLPPTPNEHHRPSKGIQTEPADPAESSNSAVMAHPASEEGAEHRDGFLVENAIENIEKIEVTGPGAAGGPLPTTQEPLPATKVPLLTTEEPLSTTKAPLPADQEPLPAPKDPLPTTQEPLSTAKEHPRACKEPLHVTTEPLQATKEPLQITRAETEFLQDQKAVVEVAGDEEDTPPELPKKQKSKKMQQRVEAAEKDIGGGSAASETTEASTELAIEDPRSHKSPTTGNGTVALEDVVPSSTEDSAKTPGKPRRQSSKVSSSSDSSPIIVKLRELRIVEDEGHPKAEAQMNIQALQELVETLVDQYCGNSSKTNEPSAIKHSMSKTDDADTNVEEPEAMLERQLEDDLSEAVSRNFGSAARRSLSVGSSASSGWMPEDKISNLDAENTTGTTNSSTTTTSASDDPESDDQLAGRLLERWQARMREQMINMDFNLPEKQRRTKKVVVPPLRSQSVSEEENNGGIYEPIGNFLHCAAKGSTSLEEPRSANGTGKRYARAEEPGSGRDPEEDGSLNRFGRRGSKRNSGFQGNFNNVENLDDGEQKDPFLFWRDLCARKYIESSSELQASEKLIRRLSVNGQRQPVKKDDVEQSGNSESGDDKARVVAATTKNPLARASSFQSSREAQYQVYENVFTTTPHRMVVVDGMTTPNQYENCNPAVAPYWTPAGPIMPYGPAIHRRYPPPPYQAITVMPFMAPPIPPMYADPRFHPGGFLAPAYGGYVYPAHPDMTAAMPARHASRQAEKCGAGRTPTDRASDSSLQETNCSRRNPKNSAASLASSTIDGHIGEATDEECSEGKKNRDAVPGKTEPIGNSCKITLKADSGKTVPIADACMAVSNADACMAFSKADANAVQKADDSKTVPKVDTSKTVSKSDASKTVPKADAYMAASKADASKTIPKADAYMAFPKTNASKTVPIANSSKIARQAVLEAEEESHEGSRHSAVQRFRAKSRSLDRHSYANIPPSPPPRGSSSNRSSRLAANCDWLKEKSKSVEAKIKAARGDNDGKRLHPVVRTEAVRPRSQSDNPKLQTKSAIPIPKPRSSDSKNPATAKEKPPAHPAKPQDPSPAANSDKIPEAAKRRLAAPTMTSSVVIGGIRVPTPLNLWPLEYELIAPELRKLKARMEGKPPPQDAEADDCDPSDVDKLAVDRLLKQLEIAIGTGKGDEAATLARDLAQLKIQCLVVRNRNPTEDGQQLPIILNMFVEDKVSHHGPIPIRVLPSITVGELKTKIFQEFEFPTVIQRWILGKDLANDDKLPISSFGVNTDGCPVFLYLLPLDDLRVKSNDLVWDDNISPRTTGARAKSSPPAKAARVKKPTVKKTRQPEVQEQRSESPPVSESNSEVGSTRLLGWSCEICTLVNIPTRPGCAMCGNERPADYVVPEQYKLRESELERMEREKEQERAIKEAEELQRLQNWQNYLKLEDQDVIYNEAAFECSICFAEAPPGHGVKLRDCLHSFCCDCLRHAVTHSEAATVICPFRDENYSCDSVLQEREIRALVPPDVFERYLQRSMKTAESQAPNSFHCKTPDCLGWCLIEDNANEFFCPVCSHLNCITCRAIHQEMNCKQYQDKLTVLARTDDEAKKTKDAIDVMLRRGEAMNCPNCQVIIMKKWGCDWLCCSVCKTEICWVTKGPRWGPNGRGDLSAGCKCGTNGVRCHPNCTYCH